MVEENAPDAKADFRIAGVGPLVSLLLGIKPGTTFLGMDADTAKVATIILVGALMIGVIRNAMNLANLDSFFQLIVLGIVIIVAVESDVLRGHLENRLRLIKATRT